MMNTSSNIFSEIAERISQEEIIFEDITYNFTKEVYEILKRKGISQKELANRLDCSPAFISKLMAGDNNITIKTMAKILSAISSELKMQIVENGVEGYWIESNANQYDGKNWADTLAFTQSAAEKSTRGRVNESDAA